MNSNIPELIVTTGPLAGSRFAVTEQGLRLGRSSSCEICIQDPALSRNHCLFELRDGKIWVTDLASANGTAVNDEELGDSSRAVSPGDVISAGESALRVAGDEAGGEGGGPAVDLGLDSDDDDEAGAQGRGILPRVLLWGAALAAVGAATWLVMGSPAETEEEKPAGKAADSLLRSFHFERVRANPDGIFRYAVGMDGNGELVAELDDTQGNRHLRKSAALPASAKDELAKLLSDKALLELEESYVADAARPNELKSVRLRAAVGTTAFETYVENETEPDALREAAGRLEAFSMGQLGILGISMSREELESRSAEARDVGDAKWDERDVEFGNIARAIASYDEAVYYLETVNPKPADYDSLLSRRAAAKAELARRYDDQRIAAERAVSLEDWETAQRELRILCEMVPDSRDPRHDEASNKLLDVEARLKNSKKKGKRL